MRVGLLTILFGLIQLGVWAQPEQDKMLLDAYLSEGDCERALLYFPKVYDAAKNKGVYYKSYFNCLVEQGDVKEAKKLVRQYYKGKSGKAEPLFDEGLIYWRVGDQAKASGLFQKAIEELPEQRAWVVKLANQFNDEGLPEWSLTTYQTWSGNTNPKYGFYLEMAGLYGSMGEFDRMVDAYLELVVENPVYQRSAQAAFYRYLDFDEDEESRELLRKQLLIYRQKYSDNSAFSEMLIWFFTAIKDFGPALAQQKAMVRRTGLGHQKLISLAIQAYKFDEFDIAMDAIQFLEGEGEKINALRGDVDGLRLLLERKQCVDKCPEWVAEAKEFTLVNQFSRFKGDLCEQVYQYLNVEVQADTAFAYLEELLNSALYTAKDKGKFKLWQGDWWLENGDVWEAGLLYGQVERRFKQDFLGSEAKFRSALISYYTGDFTWAQAQLKVLKASTSKLMSNDALELGVLISDNLGIDSIDVPLSRFSQADLTLKQGKTDEARALYQSILTDFPKHSLQDEIWFRFFELDYANGKTEVAKEWLERIVAMGKDDLYTDDAVYFLGRIAEEEGDVEKARIQYLELLKTHPDSFYSEEVRRKLRKLKGNDNL